MNGTCFQDQIGFMKFSISPEFVPLLMDKDLLHKIFVSLREIKQELYAKSFQVNDLRRGGSRIFLGGGALLSCSSSTPIKHIIFFFCRIPVVLENRRSS